MSPLVVHWRHWLGGFVLVPPLMGPSLACPLRVWTVPRRPYRLMLLGLPEPLHVQLVRVLELWEMLRFGWQWVGEKVGMLQAFTPRVKSHAIDH